MDRGGAEAMIMNYMRNIDRDIIKFDFLTNRDYRAAYEDEIEQLGGKIYHMCPMYPKYFRQYKKEVYNSVSYTHLDVYKRQFKCNVS